MISCVCVLVSLGEGELGPESNVSFGTSSSQSGELNITAG